MAKVSITLDLQFNSSKFSLQIGEEVKKRAVIILTSITILITILTEIWVMLINRFFPINREELHH